MTRYDVKNDGKWGGSVVWEQILPNTQNFKLKYENKKEMHSAVLEACRP